VSHCTTSHSRTRETKREARKLNGECSVAEGPSGVSTGRQKPRSVAPCFLLPSVIQSPTRLRISGPWGDVVEAQCQQRTRSTICRPRK
jgi:hypothetical protein